MRRTEKPAPGTPAGYLLIMLMLVVFTLSVGFLVAVPVWQTEIQREKEEELIFRGRQYVEAVRLYGLKNPGRFPLSLDELLEKKCIRRLYRDPMTRGGRWDIILNPGRPGQAPQAGGTAVQEVLIAPESALPSIKNAQIMGVVSSSKSKSVKIYNDQESYDKWLFYYGQDPKKLPKIIRYGEKD
jgi:type II secretory pathway pseudopilin PulG